MVRVRPKSDPSADRELRQLTDLEAKGLNYFSCNRPIYRLSSYRKL
jgi:hypothetical protein